jgi:hypothetical protein
VDEATVKVTGYSREELIGTDFTRYFTEPEKARAGYETAFRDDQPEHRYVICRFSIGQESKPGIVCTIIRISPAFRESDIVFPCTAGEKGVFPNLRGNAADESAPGIIERCRISLCVPEIAAARVVQRGIRHNTVFTEVHGQGGRRIEDVRER